MVETVAKGTLVADDVAADTVAGVPPCIMGTFWEEKSCKHKYTEERCRHTRQVKGEGEKEPKRKSIELVPLLLSASADSSLVL